VHAKTQFRGSFRHFRFLDRRRLGRRSYGHLDGSEFQPERDFALTYTFKQDGEKLSGTVTGPQGDPMPLIDCNSTAIRFRSR